MSSFDKILREAYFDKLTRDETDDLEIAVMDFFMFMTKWRNNPLVSPLMYNGITHDNPQLYRYLYDENPELLTRIEDSFYKLFDKDVGKARTNMFVFFGMIESEVFDYIMSRWISPETKEKNAIWKLIKKMHLMDKDDEMTVYFVMLAYHEQIWKVLDRGGFSENSSSEEEFVGFFHSPGEVDGHKKITQKDTHDMVYRYDDLWGSEGLEKVLQSFWDTVYRDVLRGMIGGTNFMKRVKHVVQKSKKVWGI